MNESRGDATGQALPWVSLRVGAVCALSALSVVVSKLSLVAGLLTFLAFVSLPEDALARTRKLKVALLVSGVLASAGILRFIALEAMPGIVQGGNQATRSAVVSRLREILFAEDAMRRLAPIDPDGDRVGSAGFLSELSGALPFRSGSQLAPILSARYRELLETRLGPASEFNGYLFFVCLPKEGGGFTADPSAPVDDERAERRFLAYAWPFRENTGPSDVFAIDEHERILVANNRAPNGSLRFHGPKAPPPCSAALDPSSGFADWKGKKPRDRLPGDPGSEPAPAPVLEPHDG